MAYKNEELDPSARVNGGLHALMRMHLHSYSKNAMPTFADGMQVDIYIAQIHQANLILELYYFIFIGKYKVHACMLVWKKCYAPISLGFYPSFLSPI